MEYKYEDVKIGDVFNNLQVVNLFTKTFNYPSRTRKEKIAVVKCLKCNSNELLEIKVKQLLNGNTGICKHCRNIGKRIKGNPNNNNTYDLESFDYGVGYTNNGKKFYFDLEDYDKIKNYCWHINQNGYVQTQINKNKILMHRFILDLNDDNLCVDHINRKRNYNLKSNLNIVTKRENSQNSSLSKTNTSGVKGVSYDNNSKLWIACLQIDKKRFVKTFKNKEDAIKMRKEFEFKYFDYLRKIGEIS